MIPQKTDRVARTRKEAPIFTFYSFKGGVGRSMALINVAALLARRGRRVLIIDLDLEAPGVSYLAESGSNKSSPETSADRKARSEQKGFVEALYDLLANGTQSPLGSREESNPFAQYIHELDITEFAQAELEKDERLVVHLMPAGDLRDQDHYREKLGALALEERYQRGEAVPMLRHFKKLLRERPPAPFDYILVDSRTGLSAEAGAAVRDLADHLIVVMGLNKQNREGTEHFLRGIRAREPHPQTLSLVISPIPIGDDELAEQRINDAETAVSRAWKRYIQATALIPYHPRLALEEKPHTRRRTNDYLSAAYQKLLSRIKQLAQDDSSLILRQFDQEIKSGKYDNAAALLDQWPRDENPQPLMYILQNQDLLKAAGSPSVESLVTALARYTSRHESAARVAALHYIKTGRDKDTADIWRRFLQRDTSTYFHWETVAAFWREQARRPEEAQRIYDEALKVHPKSAPLWNNSGSVLWEELGDIDGGERHYRRAIELDPEEMYIDNLVEILLIKNELREAREMLNLSWTMSPDGKQKDPLRTLLLSGILEQLEGRPDRAHLGRIATLLRNGARVLDWHHVALFERLKDRIPFEAFSFYLKLAGVLTGAFDLDELDNSNFWKNLEPLPVIGPLFEASQPS